MAYRAVIFDLDGTLADSLDDLAAAGNHMLTQLGRPTHDRERYRYLVGQGLDYLVEHALGPGSEPLHARAATLFRDYYLRRMGEHTRPYPGVEAMLRRIETTPIKKAVLTNKPHDAVEPFMAEHFPGFMFDALLGVGPGTPPKPDTTGARRLLQALQLKPSDAMYVGDTEVDMQTGRASGMFTVGVTWGFRPEHLKEAGAEVVIDEPEALLPLLDLPGV